MATKTEITKILFRRGEDENRRQLYTTYGGLDVGEPGFTASDRLQPNVLSANGYTIVSGSHTPDATTITRPAVNGGVASVPGADLWMGCQQGEDIFIGGQSSELYNQSRFVPLKGTDLAWPNPYIDGDINQRGKLTIGVSASGHDTKFYASGASLAGQYMEWDASCAVLNLSSTTALVLPNGPTDDRPGNGLGTNSACASALGMVRYNNTLMSFEGLQGINAADPTLGVWSGLGGLMSKDRKTYATTEVPQAPDGCGNTLVSDSGKSLGAADTLTFVTSCEYAGKFDKDGNLWVRGKVYSGNNTGTYRDGTVKAGCKLVQNGTNFFEAGTEINIDRIVREGAGNYNIYTSGQVFESAPIVNVSGPGADGFTVNKQQPSVNSVAITLNDDGTGGGASWTGVNAKINVLQPVVNHAGSAKDGDDHWRFGYRDSSSPAGGYLVEAGATILNGLSFTGSVPQTEITSYDTPPNDTDVVNVYRSQGSVGTALLNGYEVYANAGASWFFFVKNGNWQLSTGIDTLPTTAPGGFFTFGVAGAAGETLATAITNNRLDIITAVSDSIYSTTLGATNGIDAAEAGNFSGTAGVAVGAGNWAIYMMAV